jgi:predicted acyl esterase
VINVISSQRYTDPTIVAAKRADRDYAVQLVSVEVEGEEYMVVDGHHSLAAARADGVEPEWEELPASHELAQEARRDGELFLEAHHSGDDYYNVVSGLNVW